MYVSYKDIKTLQSSVYFSQLQAQLQLSAMMTTLPAHFTTSPMGVIPLHLQKAALMPSSLEWPRSLSLKIPSTLASPTVSSSQTHVSTAVYTYWPICCIAVSTSMLIRVLDKADSREEGSEMSGFLGLWDHGVDSLLCCLWNSQGVPPAWLRTVGSYWLSCDWFSKNHLSTWSWNQGLLILKKIEKETRNIIRMYIYQLLEDRQLVGFKFVLLKIIKMYTVGSQKVLCCTQMVSILLVLCSLFSPSSQHETCCDSWWQRTCFKYADIFFRTKLTH